MKFNIMLHYSGRQSFRQNVKVDGVVRLATFSSWESVCEACNIIDFNNRNEKTYISASPVGEDGNP